jgi:hypothetical protein
MSSRVGVSKVIVASSSFAMGVIPSIAPYTLTSSTVATSDWTSSRLYCEYTASNGSNQVSIATYVSPQVGSPFYLNQPVSLSLVGVNQNMIVDMDLSTAAEVKVWFTEIGNIVAPGTISASLMITHDRANYIGINTPALTPITTQGDLIVGDATGNAVRLGIGTASQVLTVSGSTAVWETPGGGGGAATTMGHSWERPDPVVAGVGAVFINTDDGGEYVSSGIAATNGVPLSGWMRRLPSGMAPTRAGLISTNFPNTTYPISTDKISLLPYTTNNCTFAMHYYWTGTITNIYYLNIMLSYGTSNGFTEGAGAGYYQPFGSGPIYLDLITNNASTFIGAAIPPVAGYNTLVFAPVTVTGSHYWRWSYNGSAVVDTPMNAPYLPPTTYNYFAAWGMPNNDFWMDGKGIDLAAWTTLLSNADMAILSNPPAGTYGLLETASTGPAAIRIEANRFDSSSGVAPNNGWPIQAMTIRGSERPANVYNYNKKVNLP